MSTVRSPRYRRFFTLILIYFLIVLITVVTAGPKIRFVISSNMKFPPASPKNIYATTLLKPASVPQAVIPSRKNAQHPSRNTPVLTMGQISDAPKTPAKEFHLLKSL